MKIKLNLLILLAATIMLSISCKQKNKANENLAPNVHKVTAEEVIQSSSYTYVRVTEDSKENWIAISKREVETGKSYYYQPSVEMNDFVSKELKRTFKSIVFVDKFSDQPITNMKATADNSSKGNQPAVAKEGIKVEPVEGGITVTTSDVAKVGDVVTVEGSVTLKKDFGAGYFYEVIVENGKMVPQM